MSSSEQLRKTRWIHGVLERFERPLLQYALSITGSLERARDVVQETFLRLHGQEEEKIEGYLSQWLFTVCRNCALKMLRKEKRLVYGEAESFADQESEEPTPAMILERKERVTRMMEFVEGLPANQQEVIRLRFQNHHSYREIADITGFSLGNVGFLINAALRSLRTRLERDDRQDNIIPIRRAS